MMGRRIGLICFNEEIFEDIFRIPKGVRVHGMWHDMSNRSIMIRIEPVPDGGWEHAFPIIEDGAVIPRINTIGREFPAGYRLEVTFRWWFISVVRKRIEKLKAGWEKIKEWRP